MKEKNKIEILNNLSVYDFARGLSFTGDVELNRKYEEKDKNIYHFTIQSDDIYSNEYNAYITMSNAKIQGCKCNCQQYRAIKSCKHIAACFINYEDELFKIDTYIDPYEVSSKILKSFKQVKRKNTIKKKVNFDIEICKTENRYYNTYNYKISYKIGFNKMYSLNSKFQSFVDYYQDESKTTEFEFGKEFTYKKDECYLDNIDTRILEYIKTFTSYENLNSTQMSNFINFLNGEKEIKLTSGSKSGTFKEIVDECLIETYIKKENDDYIVDFTNLDKIIFAGSPAYAFYDKKIHKITRKERQLINQLNYYDTKKLVIPKDNLSNFTDGLLNVIKSNTIIDKNINEIVICNKPKVKLYFDYYYNGIECNIAFDYNGKEINYFKKSKNIIRDIEHEDNIFNKILEHNFIVEDNKLLIKDLDDIGNFFENDLKKFTELYEVYTSDKIKKTNIKNTNARTTFSIGRDNILSYKFDLGDISNDEINDMLNNLKLKRKYYRLKSGDLINIEEDNNLKQINNLLEDMELTKVKDGVIPKYRAIYLDSLKNNKYSIINTNNLFDNFIDKFNKFKDLEIDFSKEDLQILRDYQVIGVKWLYNIYKCELGSILADEMGLGKSIQFIYLIKQIIKENKDAKILIVAPTSLIYNWEKEFEKFGSELKYKVVYGNKEYRKEILNKDNINIYITTYGLIREDVELYENIEFEAMGIDEAQNIKNITTQVSKCVKKINSKVKFALTGTPIENSVIELWSIFDFIMPGYLANLQLFNKKYNIKEMNNEDVKKLDTLNTQISPFILRRKKADVLKDLPEKIENTIYIELGDDEKKIYAKEVDKAKNEMERLINEKGFDKVAFNLLCLITKLRQLCIDPRLIYDDYEEVSSKMKELTTMTKNIIANNHKILIFSSFKSAIDLINKEFTNEGISTYVIDGSVSSKKRMELVDKFNKDDTNVFLITIKSGGTGLNLTSADVVIHLDLWWNPQVENQATDRAHRIGQKKTVEVIKLICKGTIEERILELQNKKKLLANTLIEGNNRDKNIVSKLTEEDIKSLFNYDNE